MRQANSIIVFFIASLLFSCQQKPREVVQETYPNSAPKIIAYFDGNVKVKEIELYESGQKKSEILFRDSLMHGSYTAWFEDGNVMETGKFEMGKRVDTLVQYRDKDILRKVMVYENGKMVKFISYYPTGEKGMEVQQGPDSTTDKYYTWYKNGQLEKDEYSRNGPAFHYYEDGKKQAVGQIKYGERNGHWQFWDETGKLIKEINYETGLAVDSVLHK